MLLYMLFVNKIRRGRVKLYEIKRSIVFSTIKEGQVLVFNYRRIFGLEKNLKFKMYSERCGV